jgi:RIO-like serine/threonine protein kinase
MNNFCSVGTQVMVFFLLFLFDQCPGEAIEKSENSFEMIIGFIICYAEHGLIQCDFNEFNY